MPDTAVTIRQCVILPGGAPSLPRLLYECLRFGVQEFLLLTEHAPEPLAQTLAAIKLPRRPGLTIFPVTPGCGTAGALAQAHAQLHNRFLVLTGDSKMDFNLADLLADAAGDGPDVLCRMVMRRFASGLANAGAYVIRAGLAARIAPPCALVPQVLLRLATEGRLRATIAAMPFRPANPRRALFLDRDGVINQERGYVGTRRNFSFLPGAREALRDATQAGWHIFIVTNQPAIARGFYTEAELDVLHSWMIEDIRGARGNIDDLRLCPCHPDGSVPKYRRESPLRMPAPGMIRNLLASWDLDAAQCVLVSTQPAALAAAHAAGLHAWKFEGGNLAEFLATRCVGQDMAA